MNSDFETGGPSDDPRDVGTRSDGGTWDRNDPTRPSAGAQYSAPVEDDRNAGRKVSGSADDPIRLHPDDTPGLSRVLAWLRQRGGANVHVHFDPSAEPFDPAQPLALGDAAQPADAGAHNAEYDAHRDRPSDAAGSAETASPPETAI